MTRIGLVGLGAMGRNHLRVLGELDGAELVAVCDQDAALVAAARRKYGVAGHRDWKDLYAREDIDAAIIALPTRFHLEAGRAALERGLHVLVEKPIAPSLEEGQALVDAASRADRVLAVGHIERFNPAVRELKRRVAAGDLGRVFQIHASRQGPFPARIRDVGVVVDLATHDLDIMQHVVGSDIRRVYAEAERRIHTEYEDLLDAVLKFENGVIGVLQVNWLTPTKLRQLSVLGEKGLFVANYLTQELTYFKNANVELEWEAMRNLSGVSEGEMVRFPIAQAEPLRLELQAFVESVAGAPIEVDGQAGLTALRLALALVTSATEGRAVELGEAPVSRPGRRGGR
ncbi:MAG TPA: Gfo/Idh/MocA family oxidoreductase [Candidatus Dormibacteraeota bacterium]|nr:Gfo/Idh/MocA family oxidoreductase [Candidatus Dormibacteraeota bacterium]